MDKRQDKKTKIATCDNCKQNFACQPFRITEHENGKRKHLFCCKKCEGEYIRKHVELNCECPICNKKFHRKKNEIERIKNICCSKECSNELKKQTMLGENNHQYGLLGDKNSSWKSDEKISYYGYKLIRKLDHPFKNSDGFVFEHRLVAEEFLLTEENSILIDGKNYLDPSFVVHHIDFNKLNNSPENLQIMTRAEHSRYHNKQ